MLALARKHNPFKNFRLKLIRLDPNFSPKMILLTYLPQYHFVICKDQDVYSKTLHDIQQTFADDLETNMQLLICIGVRGGGLGACNPLVVQRSEKFEQNEQFFG